MEKTITEWRHCTQQTTPLRSAERYRGEVSSRANAASAVSTLSFMELSACDAGGSLHVMVLKQPYRTCMHVCELSINDDCTQLYMYNIGALVVAR